MAYEPGKDPVILHCDLNGFFASVECLYRPELRAVPMAVCGDPEARHGIILAKNELAKGFGVQTAETIAAAKKKCPELVLVSPHRDRYSYWSRVVGDIYAQYTDMVEPFGIDESWLDVTGSRSLFGDGETIAHTIRERVRRETGLTISVGVSFCKVFAKLGSDLKKPDAVTLIPREKFREIVWPLPASAMLFVGRSVDEKLKKLRIRTIGELAAAPPRILQESFGKLGDTLGTYARGEQTDPVRRIGETDEVKSVGNGMTFARDLQGEEDLRSGVLLLAESVASRLRRAGAYCRTVNVQIKSPALHVISRQKSTARPTAARGEIAEAAMEILREVWPMQNPVRALTITAQNLVFSGEAAEQSSLFDDADSVRRREKNDRLESAIDAIRGRYGRDALIYGASTREDIIAGHEKKSKKTADLPIDGDREENV